MIGQQLLLAAHILLAGGWIGADVGVMITTRRMLAPSAAGPLRVELGRLADLLDMGARSALVLMLGSGLLLTSGTGLALTDPAGRLLAATGAVVALLWLAGLWHQWWVGSLGEAAGAHPRSASFQRAFRVADLGVRTALVAALLAVALGAWVARTPALPGWFALKLALFALIVALGISIRFLIPPLARALNEVAVHGSAPERERLVARAAAPLYPVVWAIWALVAVITALSVVRP